MPLSLPPPDKRQLARSPLALVVCQIKFEELIAATDTRVAVAFHDALGGRTGPYQKLEPAINQTINVIGGPGGVQSSAQPRQGWRLRSTDGSWTVVLMPDNVILETSRYVTWI
ncbi:MAG: TIGR04255 family protein, partial [Chloroflexota bacterium]